jgi:hypothetical protein
MSPGVKIGLFGIGLDTYWPQFEGLKDRLEGYLNEVKEKLCAISPNIVNAGLVDNVDKAFEAGTMFRKEDVDLIPLCYHLCTFINRTTRGAALQGAGIILTCSNRQLITTRSRKPTEPNDRGMVTTVLPGS